MTWATAQTPRLISDSLWLWKGHCRGPRNLGICSISLLLSCCACFHGHWVHQMLLSPYRFHPGGSFFPPIGSWTWMTESRHKQKRNVWLKMPIRSVQSYSSGYHRNDTRFIIHSSRAAALGFQWPMVDYELSNVHTDRNGGTGVPVWRSVWSLKVSGLIHRDFKAIKGYLGKQIQGM